MGVSKESFCRLPQLWERVRLEIAKKRTDRILPPHARIHEPISLHGLRPSFFPFFPYPFLASRLCQISLLIWYRSRRSTVSWTNSGRSTAYFRLNTLPGAQGKISWAGIQGEIMPCRPG